MKCWKAITGFCLAAFLSGQITAYAQVQAPDGYEADKWEQLHDNRLEYDEIEARIVNFSPAYLSMEQTVSKNYSFYETAIAEMKSLNSANRSDLNEAKKEGDSTEAAYLSSMVRAGENAVKGYEKAVKVIKGTTDRTLNTTVKGALVSGTQILVLNYHRLNYAMDVLDASLELAQENYESAVIRRGLEMITDNDVLAAQESLVSTKLQQENSRRQHNQIRQNINMLAGWSYDADILIGEIPKLDQSRIEAIEIQSDIQKAIGNNYTLSGIRRTSASGMTVAEKQSRLRKMEEMEAQIAQGISRSHQNVLESQAVYEAAVSAFASANLSYEGAKRQYEMGMLSALQFKQLTVAYLSQRMSYENARLDLFWAMETYDWAVNGQLSLE